jgi:hypothetical protein
MTRPIRLQRWSGKHQIGDQAEMIARPHAADRLGEGKLTGDDLERRLAAGATVDEDVIDLLKRPVPIVHGVQRAMRGVGVPRLVGVGAVPGIAIADAEAIERLLPDQEANAGRIKLGVEVAGEHNMELALALLDH